MPPDQFAGIAAFRVGIVGVPVPTFCQPHTAPEPPFHSAHVLHDKLKRDIISFGKSGSSNLQGYVGNPISWLNYIKNSRFAKLGNPDEIIVYFYEGNDLNDNLLDLKLRYIERGY